MSCQREGCYHDDSEHRRSVLHPVHRKCHVEDCKCEDLIEENIGVDFAQKDADRAVYVPISIPVVSDPVQGSIPDPEPFQGGGGEFGGAGASGSWDTPSDSSPSSDSSSSSSDSGGGFDSGGS